MGYVEEYLGIPRTTAYQYSRAAYLALEFPEVIDRMRTGKLSVYVAARVEKAFRDRANLAKEKAEVLNELSGLTQAEAERKLTSVVIPMGGPTAGPTPTARLVPETRRTKRERRAPTSAPQSILPTRKWKPKQSKTVRKPSQNKTARKRRFVLCRIIRRKTNQNNQTVFRALNNF